MWRRKLLYAVKVRWHRWQTHILAIREGWNLAQWVNKEGESILLELFGSWEPGERPESEFSRIGATNEPG